METQEKPMGTESDEVMPTDSKKRSHRDIDDNTDHLQSLHGENIDSSPKLECSIHHSENPQSQNAGIKKKSICDISDVENTESLVAYSSVSNEYIQELVEGRDDQLLNLLKVILVSPEACVQALPFFDPNNTSIAVFLDVYQILTESITEHSPSTLLVLLSKIDLQLWLRDKNVELCFRKKLFQRTCGALLTCGCCPPKHLLPIYEILKKHFSILLGYMFPDLYTDAVLFLLNGIERNSLCVEIWYEAIHCFGCTALNEKSTFQKIEHSLMKCDHNRLLPANQQVLETIHLLQNRFISKVNDGSVYAKTRIYLKPLGIFLSWVGNLLLGLFSNESSDTKESFNVSMIMDNLYLIFSPWLLPLIQTNRSSLFTTDDEKRAPFMVQMFTLCIKYFHEQLKCKEIKNKKSILSHFWHHYVQVYFCTPPGLYHPEFLNLPWHEFYPDVDDLEDMCTVVQSNVLGSKNFLAGMSLKIPWVEVMTNIRSSFSNEYYAKILGTLGRLLFISGWLEALKYDSSCHQTLLNSLADLPWYLLSLKDINGSLMEFFSGCDLIRALVSHPESCCSVYMSQFLKKICCMRPDLNIELYSSRSKRLLYMRKYVNAFISFGSCGHVRKNSMIIKSVMPLLLVHVDNVCRGLRADEQISSAMQLTKESFRFLKYCQPEIEDHVVKTVLLWIELNPHSPLFLPCFKVSCNSLKSMTQTVRIVESCISTRFNMYVRSSVVAMRTWKKFSSCFVVPRNDFKEYARACLDTSAFLALYCHILHLTSKAISDDKLFILNNLVEWVIRFSMEKDFEAKSLLLWDKILELSIELASTVEHLFVKRYLEKFCVDLTALGEDKSRYFVPYDDRQSSLSKNYTFLCRVMAAYLQLQMPDNSPLRIESMAPGHLPTAHYEVPKDITRRPSPSAEGLKALESLKAFEGNQSSVSQMLIDAAVKFVIDPKHTLLQSRQLLKKISCRVLSKEAILYSLGY